MLAYTGEVTGCWILPSAVWAAFAFLQHEHGPCAHKEQDLLCSLPAASPQPGAAPQRTALLQPGVTVAFLGENFLLKKEDQEHQLRLGRDLTDVLSCFCRTERSSAQTTVRARTDIGCGAWEPEDADLLMGGTVPAGDLDVG